MGRRLVVLLVLAALSLAACSSSTSSGSGPTSTGSAPGVTGPVTVTLLTHDSFAVSKKLLSDFEERTGITVKIVASGDAGEVVNRAVLTAGNPEGDVLFGIDNTLMTRALDAGVFEPYTSPELAHVAAGFQQDTGGGEVTPIDYGDVCVNIDDSWFASHQVPPPTSIDDLTNPTYKDLLVVENPATSSPGLAFLLATIARYGDGWQDYWTQLRANGVKVDNGWTEAYSGDFSGSTGHGDRPLVVSYASSPPAEIVYAPKPKPTTPGTSVLTSGCFRQVEYAGVLAGTKHQAAAQAVVDWLLSPEVQADVPLSMFVFPVRAGVPLPKEFTEFAPASVQPEVLPADQIAANREQWVETWTDLVLH